MRLRVYIVLGSLRLVLGMVVRVAKSCLLTRPTPLQWKASENEDTVRIMFQPYEKREKDKEKEKENAGRRSWWPFT